MGELIQQLVNGLALGGTYALLALGLAIVFSILGLVNFAHGELLALSGYAMYGLHLLGAPFAAMALGGLAAGALAAVAMERLAFRPVRHASPTTMLLTSFGLSIAIQSALASFVSARGRSVPRPDWITSSFELLGLRLQVDQVLTIGVAAVALVALAVVFKRSTIGIAMRAATQDFDATRLMGIRANVVIATAFAISGLLAAVAAVLLVAHTGSVTPRMGFLPVLSAFVACVIGGIGSLSGAVLGGFAIGLAEVLLRAYLPGGVADYANGALFALVALLLVTRPQGLRGQRVLEKV